MRSFGYALEGIATMLRTQPNFWIHVLAAAAAVVLGISVRLPPGELALIILTIAVVLVVEAINTAVETICDLVSPAPHPLVKRAKDISAAAVLIAALGALTIGILLFGPRLANLLS